ncbi:MULTISPECIES: oxidoreductase [Prauserella salsuginis group]|uniref:Oxidoreductase n=1 Tax=Prauserella salsuginis TaxID=387889 RepID=A0ABW6FX48_9PSEU|nr:MULTISPECIES: oxidoreductase [Prauserella salsuginis group]MCR3720559.1 hypothetical protein [Prauserella flava]MCR3733731.1 hypothetical protein [Prauserella salsuginis]
MPSIRRRGGRDEGDDHPDEESRGRLPDTSADDSDTPDSDTPGSDDTPDSDTSYADTSTIDHPTIDHPAADHPTIDHPAAGAMDGHVDITSTRWVPAPDIDRRDVPSPSASPDSTPRHATSRDAPGTGSPGTGSPGTGTPGARTPDARVPDARTPGSGLPIPPKPAFGVPRARRPGRTANAGKPGRPGRSGAPDEAASPDDGDRYDPFDPDSEPDHVVDASELVPQVLDSGLSGLLRWRKQSTNAPIVQVENAYITGRLDLRGADLRYLFRFERCRFEHAPDVREAKLLGLVFQRCRLPGLLARNLRTGNDLRLIKSYIEAEAGGTDGETTMRRADGVDRGMPDAAVNLTDAVIEGSAVFTATRIVHPQGKALHADRLLVTGALLAYRLDAEGEVRIPGLRTGGNVNFSGALLRNPDGFALNGNGAVVGGSLLCEVDRTGGELGEQRFRTRGLLYLPSMRVSGDLNFRGAELKVKQGGVGVDTWKTGDWYVDPYPALIADRLHVEGNVELSDGLDVDGTLRMVNSRLGGSLRLAESHIRVLPSRKPPFRDRAVHLDGSEISGDLDSKGIRAKGQVRIADVTIRGNVHLTDGTFSHPGRDVLSLRRSSVSGNLKIRRCHAEGTLRLMGITVGGSIDLQGTEVGKPERKDDGSCDWAVDLRSVRVARSVLLTAEEKRPFTARGGVTMDGAQIQRQLDVTGAQLCGAVDGTDDPATVAFDAGDTHADEFVLAPGSPPLGKVVLLRAHCGTLTEDADATDTGATGAEGSLWLATGGLDLEDFRYDSLGTPIGIDDTAEVRRRLRLLHDAIGGYRPGPYDQFAAMLRSSGNEEHADWVLAKKQQYRYESLAHGKPVVGLGVRLWSLLQRWTVGYGYRPMRAVVLLLLLLVAGSVWFGVGVDGCIRDGELLAVDGRRCAVNADDTGLNWNPVLFTVDLLVPIVDFGNKGRWHLSGADMWVATGFTAMGWVLATTAAAGMGRALRRNNVK